MKKSTWDHHAKPIYLNCGIYTIDLPLNCLYLSISLSLVSFTFSQYVHEVCVVERLLYCLITNSLKVISDAGVDVAYYTLINVFSDIYWIQNGVVQSYNRLQRMGE